jgi:hypothetical protein
MWHGVKSPWDHSRPLRALLARGAARFAHSLSNALPWTSHRLEGRAQVTVLRDAAAACPDFCAGEARPHPTLPGVPPGGWEAAWSLGGAGRELRQSGFGVVPSPLPRPLPPRLQTDPAS